MNKPNKKNTTLLVATVTAGAVAWKVNALHRDLYGRFPEIDRKIVRKAYRRFLWKAMTDQLHVDLDELTDEMMDRLFLIEVDHVKNHG